MTVRPRRKAIPVATKKAICARQNGICECGCGRPVEWKAHRASTRYDHTPAVFLRPVNASGTDYEPAQLDPKYIVARCLESDERRRSGGPQRATTAGRDTNAMAKQRRRDKPPEAKRAWPSRPLKSASRWPQGQKIRSAGFQKKHRPMRGRKT